MEDNFLFVMQSVPGQQDRTSDKSLQPLPQPCPRLHLRWGTIAIEPKTLGESKS